MRARKLPGWRDRKRAGRYSPDDLHAMLLDDIIHNRPPGGPMEQGAAFLIEACARVAKARRCTPNDYFEALLAEGAAITGHTGVMLA